jgi:hypothetical protein
MFKQSMMTVAALAALAAISGASRADDDTNVAADGYRQLSCADALQAAWFNRQLERTDGDVSPEVETPAECNRELIATSSDESQ